MKRITNMKLGRLDSSDVPFMEKMLYEAVYWREQNNKPSFKEAMLDENIIKDVANWGEKDGDIGVLATNDSIPIGAAWLRYWTDDNNIRGYINKNIPVLIIGVKSDYRHLGVGKKMIAKLVEYAAESSISQISLCVSKDNYALNLYMQTGFKVYNDIGDSLNMVRKI